MIAACAFVISLVLFLRPSVGDGKETLYIRFANINQISVGTRVLFAGLPVGEVVAIEEIYNAREEPTDSEGQVYFYQLTLRIDSSVAVYNTDEIAIQTSGLLGEKSIAIIPKAPPPGITPIKITTQPLYANSEDPIQKTISDLGSLARKIELTIEDVHTWLTKNEDNISFAIQSFGCAMEQAYFTISDINQYNLVKSLQEGADSFTLTNIKLQKALQTMDDGHVFDNLGVITENFKRASHSIDLVTQNLADGKGSIGRLLKSDEMYLRFTAILSKVDTLMNDVNHYGLLFHLNKSWQRLRTQRMTLMKALSTPSDFRQFFEQEIDQINTAMARLSILIQKASETPEKEEILQSTPFIDGFSILLREVDELSSNLKLYNEELMKAEGSGEK